MFVVYKRKSFVRLPFAVEEFVRIGTKCIDGTEQLTPHIAAAQVFFSVGEPPYGYEAVPAPPEAMEALQHPTPGTRWHAAVSPPGLPRSLPRVSAGPVHTHVETYLDCPALALYRLSDVNVDKHRFLVGLTEDIYTAMAFLDARSNRTAALRKGWRLPDGRLSLLDPTKSHVQSPYHSYLLSQAMVEFKL